MISDKNYYTSFGFTCRNGQEFKPFGSSDKITNGLRLKIYDTSKNSIDNIINSLGTNSINEEYSINNITDFSSITGSLNNMMPSDFNNKYLYNWYGTLIVPTTGIYNIILRSQDTQSYLWIGDNALNPTITNYSLEDHRGTIPWIPESSYESCSIVPVTTKCYYTWRHDHGYNILGGKTYEYHTPIANSCGDPVGNGWGWG